VIDAVRDMYVNNTFDIIQYDERIANIQSKSIFDKVSPQGKDSAAKTYNDLNHITTVGTTFNNLQRLKNDDRYDND